MGGCMPKQGRRQTHFIFRAYAPIESMYTIDVTATTVCVTEECKKDKICRESIALVHIFLKSGELHLKGNIKI